MHASLDEKSMQEQIARKHVMFICSGDWSWVGSFERAGAATRREAQFRPCGRRGTSACYRAVRRPSLASEGVSQLKWKMGLEIDQDSRSSSSAISNINARQLPICTLSQKFIFSLVTCMILFYIHGSLKSRGIIYTGWHLKNSPP